MNNKTMSQCSCQNFNCDNGIVLANPYSNCISCGCVLEPISEWWNLTNEEIEGEYENGD